MRLLQCKIENFGKLQNVSIDFQEGCHTILEENGWGKSTLATFLRVMFYGFDNESSRGFKKERVRFAPWQGGTYGGSICFEVNGKTYQMTRIFDAKGKEDTFELRDAKTNMPSTDYSSNIGEELFLIDSASFQRTVFIRQADCATETTDRVNAKLGNLAEHTDDINNYEKAMQTFKDLHNQMSPTRKTASLYKMKERITELDAQTRQGAIVDAAIRELQNAREAQRQELAKLKEKQIALGISKELQAKRERHQMLCANVEKLEKELQQEQEYFGGNIPTKAALDSCERDYDDLQELRVKAASEEAVLQTMREQETPKKSGKSLLIFGGVMVLAAIVLFVLSQMVVGAVFAVAGVVLAACGVKIEKTPQGDVGIAAQEEKCKAIAEQKEKKQEAIATFLQQYSQNREGKQLRLILAELREHRNVYERLQSEVMLAKADKEAFEAATELQAEPVEDMDEDLSDISERIEALQESVLSYGRQLDMQLEKRDMISEAEEELALLKEKYKEDKKKYELLEKASKHMEDAKASFTQKYMEPIRSGFEKYYCLLTGQSADQYHLDANTHLTVEEKGLQRETEYFSKGYQDLIGICMRLALVDAMYQEEKPFIIMDDPFVNLDDSNVNGGKKLLQEVAKEYQIIYFTCHESRGV